MSIELATKQEVDKLTFSKDLNLIELNQQYRKAKPSEIMKFTIEHAKNPVIFTNFRPLAVAFLHLVTQPKPDIPVIWVDYGPIPQVDTPEHDRFSEIVKLEPFNRAMSEVKPDVWLNGIRHDQNAHRKNLDVFTFGSHNTVRVAPMFNLTELDVEEYIYDRELPDNNDYFDPTKVEEHRECGLMLMK